MFDYSPLWKPHELEQGETLECGIGSLRLWVHRGTQDWYLAHDSESGRDDRCYVKTMEEPLNPDNEWTRWIVEEKTEQLDFMPRLPDRPIIVRPEMPICLMPKQSVQFFIGMPIWLAIAHGSQQQVALEIPSLRLSNSWFGNFTEGELCYALKTTAKRHLHELSPQAHRAVFPLEIRNASTENLNFERLCLRPQFLNVFQGETRLWTSKGRVSYRGEDKWSRIVYASSAPEFDGAGPMIGKARENMKRGSLLSTFDNLKQRADLS